MGVTDFLYNELFNYLLSLTNHKQTSVVKLQQYALGKHVVKTF